jgi:nitrogenase molybdenum-iron protein alpha chain
MAKINLEEVTIGNREQRLGSIISWSGKASELSDLSGYSRGQCKGKGPGCRLCEVKGPFSQGTGCSEQMIGCQAGNIRDAVLIQHAPIGCSASQCYDSSVYRNGLDLRGIPVENLRTTSTNLQEGDLVFGGVGKLRLTIEDVWNFYTPKAIFIGTSCATGIIGDDVDSVAAEYSERLGIPVIPLHCEGFKSKHWSTGFDVTQHGILRQIVKKDPVRQEDLVNVINLWGSDVFRPMLKNLNLRVNYVVDMATVDDLAQMSEAAATVSFCNTLSTYLAEGLEQEFGVPQLKASQPYGTKGTDDWIRGLAKLTHREELAEKFIASEHERTAPIIAGLREKLKGKRGFVATGSAYSHGLISVLKELGVEVNGSMVFHHDPIYDNEDPGLDSLGYMIDNYGDVDEFTVSNRQPFQFYTMMKRLKPDFILVRHDGLAPVASRLGIPAAPLGDEHIAIGYEGIINLGKTIVEILRRRKFHEDIAKHIDVPYSRWWKEQTDINILAKHPELIDEGFE